MRRAAVLAVLLASALFMLTSAQAQAPGCPNPDLAETAANDLAETAWWMVDSINNPSAPRPYAGEPRVILAQQSIREALCYLRGEEAP